MSGIKKLTPTVTLLWSALNTTRNLFCSIFNKKYVRHLTTSQNQFNWLYNIMVKSMNLYIGTRRPVLFSGPLYSDDIRYWIPIHVCTAMHGQRSTYGSICSIAPQHSQPLLWTQSRTHVRSILLSNSCI